MLVINNTWERGWILLTIEHRKTVLKLKNQPATIMVKTRSGEHHDSTHGLQEVQNISRHSVARVAATQRRNGPIQTQRATASLGQETQRTAWDVMA